MIRRNGDRINYDQQLDKSWQASSIFMGFGLSIFSLVNPCFFCWLKCIYKVPWECKCCSFLMNVVPICICYPQEFHLCNMQEMLRPSGIYILLVS